MCGCGIFSRVSHASIPRGQCPSTSKIFWDPWHWPHVTDISGSPPMGSRPRRGRWAPPMLSLEHGRLYLYLIYAKTVSRTTTKFGTVSRVGEWRISMGSAKPPSQWGGPHHPQNMWDPLRTPKRFDLKPYNFGRKQMRDKSIFLGVSHVVIPRGWGPVTQPTASKHWRVSYHFIFILYSIIYN